MRESVGVHASERFEHKVAEDPGAEHRSGSHIECYMWMDGSDTAGNGLPGGLGMFSGLSHTLDSPGRAGSFIASISLCIQSPPDDQYRTRVRTLKLFACLNLD
jgi:hypothetical protein